MQERHMVNIDADTLKECESKGLINLSAFVDQCLNAYKNGEFIAYKCSGCGTEWYTPIKPKSCIFCKNPTVNQIIK